MAKTHLPGGCVCSQLWLKFHPVTGGKPELNLEATLTWNRRTWGRSSVCRSNSGWHSNCFRAGRRPGAESRKSGCCCDCCRRRWVFPGSGPRSFWERPPRIGSPPCRWPCSSSSSRVGCDKHTRNAAVADANLCWHFTQFLTHRELFACLCLLLFVWFLYFSATVSLNLYAISGECNPFKHNER